MLRFSKNKKKYYFKLLNKTRELGIFTTIIYIYCIFTYRDFQISAPQISPPVKKSMKLYENIKFIKYKTRTKCR